MAGLTNLQILHVRNCNKISIISSLSSLTRLRELNIEGCINISEFCLPSLTNLTRLSTLKIADCIQINDVSCLNDLPELTLESHPPFKTETGDPIAHRWDSTLPWHFKETSETAFLILNTLPSARVVVREASIIVHFNAQRICRQKSYPLPGPVDPQKSTIQICTRQTWILLVKKTKGFWPIPFVQDTPEFYHHKLPQIDWGGIVAAIHQ